MTTTRATSEEQALARAAVYRLLSLAFSYPTREIVVELETALKFAVVGAELVDEGTAEAAALLQAATIDQADLEASYQRVFTLSYSEDCPPYETAFSAQHLFQQAEQQADIAGFYRAFGVDAHLDRPDFLPPELEFCYLLALKEARALADEESENAGICRDGQRVFLSEHLARWAPLIGQRVVVTGAGSWYELAGRLLIAFVAAEELFLALGPIERFRDEPVLIADEPGEMTCPLVDTPVGADVQLPDPVRR